MPTEDPKPGDDKDKVHRLVDLLVHEVSLVDRGANRHKWLIRKRAGEEDDMKGKKVKVGEDGSLTTKSDPFGAADAGASGADDGNTDDDKNRDDTEKTVKIAKTAKDSVSTLAASAKEAIGVIVDAVKSAEEDKEKGTTIPAVISGPISTVTSSFLNLMTEFPTQKAISPDVHIIEEDEKFLVKGVDTDVLLGTYDSKEDAEKRADEIAAFKPAITKRYDHGDKAEKARAILWSVMDEVNDGAFMEEEEKTLVDALLSMLKGAVEKAEGLGQLVLAPDAKADIVSTLKSVTGEIDAFITATEETEETEDELPAPMPDVLGLELAKIAHSMVNLVTKYSTPEDDRESDGDEGDDVAKLLIAAIGKLSADKSDEEPVLQLLSKAKDLLGGGQPSDDTASGEQGQSQGEPVDKRGAKLSAARRKKFREAMKILSELFDEVVPDGEKGTWPHRNTKKSAKTKITKSEAQLDALEKRQSEVEEQIEKSEVELRKVRKELAKEMKRAQPSNAAWVEKVPDEEDFDAVAGDEVSWPSDMNSKEEF